MRPLRPGRKNFVALFAVAVAIFAAWTSQRSGAPPDKADGPGSTPAPTAPREKSDAHAGNAAPTARGADFDFYLLAMTSHPAFCADGHAREPECRVGAPVPLSIHGLWPERLAPGEYPRDCPGPPLSLDPGLALELQPLMPGMADDLHEHEWRKHGRCSGLDDDAYFRATLELARRLDSVLRAKLTTLAGQAVSAHDLRAYADSYQPGLGATLTFHCRTLRNAPRAQRGEHFLVEIRQCVDDGANGIPASPLDCASVNRRDQGCGAAFRIAEATR